MTQYAHILHAICAYPWAIQPDALHAVMEIMRLRVAGGRVDQETIDEIVAARRSSASSMRQSVAMLPLLGVLAHRMDMFSEASGGTSTDKFGQTFDAAVNNDAVSAVILDVDSPGGQVLGTPELADKIFRSRGRKPIVAVANGTAASAAYWVASAADELVVTPSGWVGSVGILAVHADASGLNEKMGVRYTYLSEPESGFKTEGNQDEPLSDEAAEYEQSQLAVHYGKFVDAVRRGRGVTAKRVEADFGRGRMVLAEEAVARGMADRVATLEDTIIRYAGKAAGRRGGRASLARRRLDLMGLDMN